ncbi:MAG: hypothetical protein A2275_17525 [Bacteroidetes bacterium RIFOXYA12_FULL_35_11]|nr:MAG: hypothetical protein A2X01_19835 [Bacteroidetes bacterium GWF2_35_48]OFY76280.1 MAG: hypothetical protein A2275_17525 [Bacteroidetes bacterium RIFOXYA12_FULL_35_11]OFY96523.1 MAG: hypothetical protein A2309_14405 [Bacteroidetes bacterium RIFOXYB2_FULL_35_7]OFZ04018.1 MAG: hypothetical protein A2491_07170 [Bacteroidetes bacterium RIFOXYC12_FULL_35_7]HBX52690.1 hypothetical protein [Bacteroidales bacterium]
MPLNHEPACAVASTDRNTKAHKNKLEHLSLELEDIAKKIVDAKQESEDLIFFTTCNLGFDSLPTGQAGAQPPVTLQRSNH